MKQIGCLFLFILLTASSLFGRLLPNVVQPGISAGFGLPQMPPSQYRFPVSVFGKADLHLRLHEKFFIKTDAAAMTSFHLGAINNQKGSFRFDLRYYTAALAGRWRSSGRSTGYVYLGMGKYHLNQEINDSKYNQVTSGLNLGLEYIRMRESLSTTFELGWHLLFHPSPNPQVLTIGFGLLL